MSLGSKMKSVAILLAVLGIGSAAATQCTPSQIHQAVQTSKHHPQIGTATRTDTGVEFLKGAAALHNQPFLVCTRAHESDTAGGYSAYNPGGPYYGAYQYLQHTWNYAAVHYGSYFPQYVGIQPRYVPGFFQDLITWNFYLAVGNGPWAGRC